MPAIITTIDRDQREGLHELVRNHLGSVEDFWVALERTQDFATAERLALEFSEDFRLLEDIGWRPAEEREAFELTMPPHDLMELLRRLQGEAVALLIESGAEAEASREDGLIDKYARPYFSGKLKLVDVTTFLLARFVDWLADEDEQGKRISDATIANIVIPLRAALSTAKREGLIRHDPSLGLALPHREEIADEEAEIKVFSREQLAAILAMAPERHRLLFEVLATCGLRISEAIALQRLHFQLDGSAPEVCIRRAIVKRQIVPPKTKYGRREVRLPMPLVYRLRSHLAAQADQDSTALVFTNRDGKVVEPDNLRRRGLEADRPGGRRSLGWLPHVPAHLRLDPPEPGDQPAPAQPRARPSLGRVHAEPLHPPAAW